VACAKNYRLPLLPRLIGGLALGRFAFNIGFSFQRWHPHPGFEWSDGKNALLKHHPGNGIAYQLAHCFYVARLIFKVFFGELRLLKSFPIAANPYWRWALGVQTAADISGALLFVSAVFVESNFVRNVRGCTRLLAPKHGEEHYASIYHLFIPALVTVVSLLVIYRAYVLYIKRADRQSPKPASFTASPTTNGISTAFINVLL
jgi:NADH-quinone oxidoreductase subunit L